MPYAIEITDVAYDELVGIKAFYRRQIIDAIDVQLVSEPMTQTRNRKILIGVQLNFEHELPIWERRVGQYRVDYDVNEESLTVSIRAVRQKPPHTTTEQSV